MKTKLFWMTTVLATALVSCGGEESSENGEAASQENSESVSIKDEYRVPIRELSDADYPDNPDIGHRSSDYGDYVHPEVIIAKNEKGEYSFTILPGNEKSDTVVFPSIDLLTYMPSVPNWIKGDEYLIHLGVINQEWNRQQVRFDEPAGYFQLKGEGNEDKGVVRMDIARNCLNSGLWELIFFKTENGKTVPYYHGWFDFPIDLYGSLFTEKSGLDWNTYKGGMLDWKTPGNKKVDLDLLRKVENEFVVSYENLNDGFYPLTGARAKKQKNIIHPAEHDKIQDFLTDETVYATFSPPGFYNTQDPRLTKLSLLSDFQRVTVKRVKSPEVKVEEPLFEFELAFKNKEGDIETGIVFGGIALSKVPQLAYEDHNAGLKLPMGISNHAFYETYDFALSNQVEDNPYYAFVLSSEGNWVDSHDLGIDGPLMFFDDENPSILHLMILSFERHSFVGHFTIDMSEVPRSF